MDMLMMKVGLVNAGTLAVAYMLIDAVRDGPLFAWTRHWIAYLIGSMLYKCEYRGEGKPHQSFLTAFLP